MSSPNNVWEGTREPYADYQLARDLVPFLALSDEPSDLILRVCADAERWATAVPPFNPHPGSRTAT